MKLLGLGIFFTLVGIIGIISLITFTIIGYYNWNNKYESYWNLADKTSTIEAKEEYITQFVDNIQKNRNEFAEYNAVFLKTPNNNCDKNIGALITLKERLKEIKTMDIKSFEYQTAIQQITAQEQGEANDMISNIESCYYLKSYIIVWGWIGVILSLLSIVLLGLGIFFVWMAYGYGEWGND